MNTGSLILKDEDAEEYEVYLTALLPGAVSCALDNTENNKAIIRK